MKARSACMNAQPDLGLCCLQIAYGPLYANKIDSGLL